ncbi:MAG: phosphotransferase [Spirochaetales bacterium]|jgi:hypothetical protein|nr:phosphotransferase [Spirochaetales bacterium]
MGSDSETELTGGGRTSVSRVGNVVHRETGIWASSVHQLLRHLERKGFQGAPRVVGSGFDNRGRETLTYIEGEMVFPGPWTEEALPVLGRLLRDLHRATDSFKVPDSAVWRPWFGRDLGKPPYVIGHCDMGPWNIITTDGIPSAVIDWEAAGPVDPLFELAQLCWLNAQLYDNDVAERVGLAPLIERARFARMILDGYGLSAERRKGLVDKLIEFAVSDAADQAIEADITPETKDGELLWGIAWRSRSAAWMMKNRRELENVIE